MRLPRTTSAALLALVAFTAGGCGVEAPPEPPPLDRFYFPTGVHHLPDPAGVTAGTLLVASSNFDRRYDFGAVTALDLQQAGLLLPDYLGGTGSAATAEGFTPGAPLSISDDQRVLTAPFAGVTAAAQLAEEWRMFVPTRSEGDLLFGVSFRDGRLSCVGADAAERDCVPHGISLTAQGQAQGDAVEEGFADGKPRAPAPYAATVSGNDLWVTHLTPSDSPVGSAKNRETYVVRTSVTDPSLTAQSFLPIGVAPASAVAVGQRHAWVSGRWISTAFQPLRLVDLQNPQSVYVVPLTARFGMLDVRDIVLGPDERRAYLLARNPDMLLVLEVDDPGSATPTVRVVGSEPLPAGPTQMRLIPRSEGRGPLLAITCTDAHALVLYDDDLAKADAYEGVVQLPFGIAVQSPVGAAGARLFVTGFGDGQVAVLDIPNLAEPALMVPRGALGPSQVCLTAEGSLEGCP